MKQKGRDNVFYLIVGMDNRSLTYVIKWKFPCIQVLTTQGRNFFPLIDKFKLKGITKLPVRVLLSNHSNKLNAEILRQFELTNKYYDKHLILSYQKITESEFYFYLKCTQCIKYTSLMHKGHITIWDPGIFLWIYYSYDMG